MPHSRHTETGENISKHSKRLNKDPSTARPIHQTCFKQDSAAAVQCLMEADVFHLSHERPIEAQPKTAKDKRFRVFTSKYHRGVYMYTQLLESNFSQDSSHFEVHGIFCFYVFSHASTATETPVNKINFPLHYSKTWDTNKHFHLY